MILLIDNYDSFTYNLVQLLGEIDARVDVQVHRNNQITCAQIAALQPTHIIISPGPCTPREGGVSNEVIQSFSGKTPLLGVCLGHQCMAYVHGGQVIRAKRLVHGKTSLIRHTQRGIFAGMPNPFRATRYHSLIVPPDGIPADFEVTAWCDDDRDEVMAMQHREWPVFGVQFHPESFLTEHGEKLLANFLAVG
jgi:anthranilate synthase/aminodeoxychorismate synthase-like glutamine amidotransferase